MTTAPTSENGLAKQVADSVVVVDPTRKMPGLGSAGASILWVVSAMADDIVPWGTAINARDTQLRQFFPSESWTLSALSTVVARNSALSWRLDGPEAKATRYHDILQSANRGDGWESFVSMLSWDLYTQDKGAFFELVGKRRPEDECIGIQHLDALRCWLTGNPLKPVIYQDIEGAWHELEWFQVVHLTELPAPVERLYGIQYCALSRILASARQWRAIQGLTTEKVTGRFTSAVHVVTGVDTDEIATAIEKAQNQATEQGQKYYMQPVIMGTLDPGRIASSITIDLKNMPDGFNYDEAFKQTLTVIAMGLLGDYQDLAPLPGGGLGTSSQSFILHMKSRGKGPALFMQKLAGAMNNRGILPRDVSFLWDEQDIEADKVEADLKLVRASARAAQIASKEIDEEAALQLAVDQGDVPPELAQQIEARRPARRAEAAAAVQVQQSGAFNNPGPPAGAGGQNTTVEGEDPGTAQKADDPATQARMAVEAEGADAVEAALVAMKREMRKALGA